MTIKGTLKSDAVTVARIEVDFTRSPIKFSALCGLVQEKTGATLAWTNMPESAWSEETMTRLAALRESMELDYARRFFHEHSAESSAGAGPQLEGGLGEHLSDATSV